MKISSEAFSDSKKEQQILQEELNILKEGICQGREALPCPVPVFVSGESMYYKIVHHGKLVEVYQDRLLYYRKETVIFPEYRGPVITKQTAGNQLSLARTK